MTPLFVGGRVEPGHLTGPGIAGEDRFYEDFACDGRSISPAPALRLLRRLRRHRLPVGAPLRRLDA